MNIESILKMLFYVIFLVLEGEDVCEKVGFFFFVMVVVDVGIILDF